MTQNLDTVRGRAGALYGEFVKDIQNGVHRAPDNEDVGFFLFFCESICHNEKLYSAITGPSMDKAAADKNAKYIMEKWKAARQGRKFDISHEDMLRYISSINE